ncbi:hypothetical protein A2U01_0058062 [Trifolium medium]|uniref:Uncharacterized protein n=1 Tax=Trifolium medium TaxID=97028 RepID=A0A392RKN4_9FABA|nr:hypothetical protein [Trifolium medium]
MSCSNYRMNLDLIALKRAGAQQCHAFIFSFSAASGHYKLLLGPPTPRD